MSTMTATSTRAGGMTKDERFVILASSLGTVFEWYDFYLFGSLASVIGAQFFNIIDPVTKDPMFNQATRDIFALLAFAAGFIVRPFGAIVFGRVGDIVGRKYTFLVTILIMGLSTFIVGVLPSAATIGLAAPIILIGLRLLQGLALGGEYGGAATYVAEHAPMGKRGYYTSFIQTTATLGLFLSLIVILAATAFVNNNFPGAACVGTECVAIAAPYPAATDPALTGKVFSTAFQNWGWRIPFLVSVVLLGISVWIRLRLNESPVFQKMKDEGKSSKAPLTEAFANWSNAKIVILALIGGTMGQGVVWYTGQFYALFFMTNILKVDAFTANLLIAWSLLFGTGFFIVFGMLSDKIGRKPIILAGCLIAALTFFPIFRMISANANPTLEKAIETVKVSVVADPKGCGDLFNPVGTRVFTAPCDLARDFLAKSSVKYDTVAGPAGTTVIKINSKEVPYTTTTTPKGVVVATASNTAATTTLQAEGYPKAADPQIVKMAHPFDIFRPQVAAVIGLLFILVIFVTMVYGPIAAMLVELFPTKIRYTSMSLPYHIGNGWFGGLLPATSFAIVASTGDIYAGLWYPIIFAAITAVVGFFFLPETKDVDITK
jgi:MFS family permease